METSGSHSPSSQKSGPSFPDPSRQSWQPRQKLSGSRFEPIWLSWCPQRGQVLPPFKCTAMNERTCSTLRSSIGKDRLHRSAQHGRDGGEQVNRHEIRRSYEAKKVSWSLTESPGQGVK